jgi:hypothetical protein
MFRKKPIAYFHPNIIAFCGFEQYKVQPSSLSQLKERNCRSACHRKYLDWNTEISKKVQNINRKHVQRAYFATLGNVASWE